MNMDEEITLGIVQGDFFVRVVCVVRGLVLLPQELHFGIMNFTTHAPEPGVFWSTRGPLLLGTSTVS